MTCEHAFRTDSILQKPRRHSVRRCISARDHVVSSRFPSQSAKDEIPVRDVAPKQSVVRILHCVLRTLLKSLPCLTVYKNGEVCISILVSPAEPARLRAHFGMSTGQAIC